MTALTAACLRKALYQLLIEDISTEDDDHVYEEQYGMAMYLLDQVVSDVRITLRLSNVGF